MDPTIAHFAAADPLFYDHPRRAASARSVPLEVNSNLDWNGWDRGFEAPWAYRHPAGLRLPSQGWKVHISSTPDGAQDVLTTVSAFCHRHRLSFKHISGTRELLALNGKDAVRASAGKFITVYPEDDDRLDLALTGLDDAVGGRPGPYILSDLRWHEGPVFTRYGGFAQAWTRRAGGERVPALRDPAGRLVEDRRIAGFAPPEWAPVPAFLRDQMTTLGNRSQPDSFRYDIVGVLHYSNAGGVYEATDRDGTRVILKEGRPHAGLTPDGRDAATRVLEEEARLRELSGSGIVSVRDSFSLHGHRFLVLDRIEGMTLNSEIVRRNPSIHATSTVDDYLRYRDWALGIADELSRVVTRIHDAGYVHGDLHLKNVVVRPGGDVVLLDFEMACPVAHHVSNMIGAPGFVPPDRRGGIAADLYALACVKISLFAPLTSLLALDTAKVNDLLDHIQQTYHLDRGWIAAIRSDLNPTRPRGVRTESHTHEAAEWSVSTWDVTTENALDRMQGSVRVALAASADFSRTDRLWPGDPRQFAECGFSLAHGAAGVLHAVGGATSDVAARAFGWLAESMTRGDLTTDDHAPGLFDGLAGIGWLYRQLGDHERADQILARVRDTNLAALGSDLYGGLAGVGLYLISESDLDPRLIAAANNIAHLLDHHQAATHQPYGPRSRRSAAQAGPAGLMWGSAGVSLFALRLFEHTADTDHLNLAIRALDDDVARCAVANDGSLQVDEGWRLNPYLATGSTGIGLVAAQMLPHAPDPERLEAALQRITAAACTPFTIEPGLFYGRAGMIHYLAALARLGLDTPATRIALARHADQLRLHALRHAGGIGFPGHGLLRMSCDLATGSAGILTALRAYQMLTFDEQRPGWHELLPLLVSPVDPSIATNVQGADGIEGR